MVRKIGKTNFILGLLVIAFFVVSISLIFDLQVHSFITPDHPNIIEIEEHKDTTISHGGDQWPLGCEECHFEPVYGECVDCHVPDYWVGNDDSIYFAHHDLAYTGFSDCWSNDCHDPDPEDVRYVKGDLIDGDTWQAWHDYCMEICHIDFLHRVPDS